MTDKDWADSIIGLLRLVISWPVVVLVLVLIFRQQVGSLLLRILKLTREGVELVPPPGPQTASSATRATTALSTTGDPAFEDMLRAFDSPVLREQEQRIRQDLQLRQIAGQAAVEVLVRHLAAFQLGYFFEWVYSQIWGSQIQILQTLNTAGAPVPLQSVRPFYDAAAQQTPAAFANYSFENYIGFLVNVKLVARTNDNIAITPLGREFLIYLPRVGKPTIKPQ